MTILKAWLINLPLVNAGKYCDQRVCIFVRPHVHVKAIVQISSIFCITLKVLPVAVARCFEGNAIRYVLPVLWIMLMFYILDLMGRIRNDAYVSSSLRGGGIEGEVCYLSLNLVSLPGIAIPLSGLWFTDVTFLYNVAPFKQQRVDGSQRGLLLLTPLIKNYCDNKLHVFGSVTPKSLRWWLYIRYN